MSENYPTLYLQIKDKREGIDAQNYFNYCIKNNLESLKTSAQLKEFIEREDVNSICEDELNKLRSLVSKIGVKETRSIYSTFHDVREFIN